MVTSKIDIRTNGFHVGEWYIWTKRRKHVGRSSPSFHSPPFLDQCQARSPAHMLRRDQLTRCCKIRSLAGRRPAHTLLQDPFTCWKETSSLATSRGWMSLSYGRGCGSLSGLHAQATPQRFLGIESGVTASPADHSHRGGKKAGKSCNEWGPRPQSR